MRMTHGISALALATLIQAAPALAQSGSMAKPMPMAKEKVYTGCIAAGTMAGSFMLEHAAEEGMGAMGKSSMGKDTMGKDTMGKGMAAHGMALSSSAVDLSKHLGHQVAVTVTETGMDKPDPMSKPDQMAKPGTMAKPAAIMSVSRLRMIAATCGM